MVGKDRSTGQIRSWTFDPDGSFGEASWARDGKKISAAVFRRGQWDLRWIDAASGDTGVITPPSASNIYVRYPEWSPRGDVVVFERGELHGNVWTLRLPDK